MHVVMLTPEKEIYAGNIKSVKVPGTAGSFEILKNHAPIVAALGKGEVRFIDEKGVNTKFMIQKGFIEVIKNEVSILVTGVKEA